MRKYVKNFTPLLSLLVSLSLCLTPAAEVLQTTFTASEIGKPIANIKIRHGNGAVAMYKGKLVFIYSRDSGAGDGGFGFLDISDPKNPVVLADYYDDRTKTIREPHGWSLSPEGVMVVQANEGVQFWDITDVKKPVQLSYLKIPGAERSDYGKGVWWTSWQGGYLYAGGNSLGIHIVDAFDPSNPKFVKTIPMNKVGDFKVGSVQACGNILTLASADKPGFALLDISDPVNPKLQDFTKTTNVYSALLNGGRLLGALGAGILEVYDVSSLTQLKLLGRSPNVGDKGGYVSVQDNYAIAGFSTKGFRKFDLTTKEFKIVGEGRGNGDEDFATPLGNMIMMGNDHSGGAALIPHQEQPDTKGPEVNFVNPPDGAKNQHPLSRIGVTLTDQIRPESVTPSSFIVKARNGKEVKGRFVIQNGMINFNPSEKLAADQIYDIQLIKDGVLDYTGNGLTKEFNASFSTGNQVTTSISGYSIQSPSNPAFQLFETGNVLLKINPHTGSLIRVDGKVDNRMNLRLR